MSHSERIDAIEAQLQVLQQELATLRATSTEEPVETSRREMFKKLALGAAAAGAAGAGAGALGGGGIAAAADGGSVVLGQTNSSTAATQINNAGGPGIGAAFVVQSGNTYSAAASGILSALAGWASTSGNSDTGVYGFSEVGDGFGVFGSSTSGVGVGMYGSRAGATIYSSGNTTQLGAKYHTAGDIIGSDDGDLWYCSLSGTPGTLRKLSGRGTAGQLHLLAAPVRVYDSRTAKGPASTGDGPMTAAKATRTVDLRNGYVGLVATAAVPAGATGAMISLTLTGTAGSGYLALFSNAVSWPGNSSINWSSSGQSIAVTTTSAIDATARVKVQSGGGAGYGSDFIVDVIGYYR